MRRIIFTFSAAILFCLLPSCNRILKEEPTTLMTYDASFESVKSLDAQMYAIYRSFNDGTLGTPMFYYLNHASLLVHWKGTTRSGNEYEQCLRGTLYSTGTSGKGIMSNFFTTINRCNAIIAGLETSPVAEAEKLEIDGEARFMRAVCYFYLVRLFGDLPLHLKPTGSLRESYVRRTPYNEVYRQIIEDLKFAEENMRTEARQAELTGDNGRPHRWAASAFLASVYNQIASILSSPDDQAFGTEATGPLTPDFSCCGITTAQQAWQLSLDKADAVISDSGYELAPDYRSLYTWDPEGHPENYRLKERILVLQHTPNGGNSNMTSQYTLPAQLYGTANYSTHASNPTRVNPSRFVYYKWTNTYGGDKSGDYDVYLNCRDPRFDASYIYGSYKQYVNGLATSTKTVQAYPNDITGTGSYPIFKKYFCPQFDQDAGYADYYVLRFADVYLLAAEASAELGTSGKMGDAYDYIEKLHYRARHSCDGAEAEQPRWTRGQFTTKEELVNAIMWERVFEMGGEGHEWFDTHRRGAKWLLTNICEPMHRFLLAKEQSGYRKLYWYDKGYELCRTVENVRYGLLAEYPEYEIRYNQSLSTDDQNWFTHYKAKYDSQEGESDNSGENDNFLDDEKFNW